MRGALVADGFPAGVALDAFAAAGIGVRLALLPAVFLELALDPARIAQHQAVDRLEKLREKFEFDEDEEIKVEIKELKF